MQCKQADISDDELLLFSDQELSPRAASKVREHVARCETCRERLQALEAASADFADFHERELRAQDSNFGNSRTQLKTRLSEASRRIGRSRTFTLGNVVVRQFATASLALLLVIGGAWAVRQQLQTRSNSDALRNEAVALPRRALTPGSARAIPIADLCSNQNLDNDPPVNPNLEQAVFSEYGVSTSSKKSYALDYLITPALGGAETIQNLWPQPSSSIWNARVKDQLEDHLHDLVCQGKVQLTTAQSDIASDWIAAYKKYFNTDKPEPGLPTAAVDVPPGNALSSGRRERSVPMISGVHTLALVVSAWQFPAPASAFYRLEGLR